VSLEGILSNRLAAHLRELCRAKGLSTRELGKAVGCSHSLIARLKLSECSIGLTLLWHTAQAVDGDFGQALCPLCSGSGVPEDVARAAPSCQG
jgi:transcriptional regulator with XRE-family HTH domain